MLRFIVGKCNDYLWFGAIHHGYFAGMGGYMWPTMCGRLAALFPFVVRTDFIKCFHVGGKVKFSYFPTHLNNIALSLLP